MSSVGTSVTSAGSKVHDCTCCCSVPAVSLSSWECRTSLRTLSSSSISTSTTITGPSYKGACWLRQVSTLSSSSARDADSGNISSLGDADSRRFQCCSPAFSVSFCGFLERRLIYHTAAPVATRAAPHAVPVTRGFSGAIAVFANATAFSRGIQDFWSSVEISHISWPSSKSPVLLCTASQIFLNSGDPMIIGSGATKTSPALAVCMAMPRAIAPIAWDHFMIIKVSKYLLKNRNYGLLAGSSGVYGTCVMFDDRTVITVFFCEGIHPITFNCVFSLKIMRLSPTGLSQR